MNNKRKWKPKEFLNLEYCAVCWADAGNTYECKTRMGKGVCNCKCHVAKEKSVEQIAEDIIGSRCNCADPTDCCGYCSNREHIRQALTTERKKREEAEKWAHQNISNTTQKEIKADIQMERAEKAEARVKELEDNMESNNPKWRYCSNENCNNTFESILSQDKKSYCEDCLVYYVLDAKVAKIKELELDIEGLKSFIRNISFESKNNKIEKLQSAVATALEAFKVIKSKYCLNEDKVAQLAIEDIERIK